MHYPHSAEADLHHPEENSLPPAIRYFAKAAELPPEIWTSSTAVHNYLAAEAHKAHFVETVCYYVSTLHDVQRLWELKVVGRWQRNRRLE